MCSGPRALRRPPPVACDQPSAAPVLESVSVERRGGTPARPGGSHSAVGRGPSSRRSTPASRGRGAFGAVRPSGAGDTADGAGTAGATGTGRRARSDPASAGESDAAGATPPLPVSTLPPLPSLTDSMPPRLLRVFPLPPGAVVPVSAWPRRSFVASGVAVGDASAPSAPPEAACVPSRPRLRAPLLPSDSAPACLRVLPVLSLAVVPVPAGSCRRSLDTPGASVEGGSASSAPPGTARVPSRPRFRLPPRRPRRFPRRAERERFSPSGSVAFPDTETSRPAAASASVASGGVRDPRRRRPSPWLGWLVPPRVAPPRRRGSALSDPRRRPVESRREP